MNTTKEIEKAEYLLYTTYPAIQNSKLLYSIVKTLNNITKGFQGIKLSAQEKKEIQEIEDTVSLYKESATVFNKEKKLVIWNGKTLKVLDENRTKNYLQTIKGILKNGR